MLQPQLWPSPRACVKPYYRSSFPEVPPHTKGRGRTALLFPTLDSFLIVWSCRFSKGLAKLVSENADYTVKTRPKMAEMAVHEKTSQVKRKVCVVTVKRRYIRRDDDSVGNHL